MQADSKFRGCRRRQKPIHEVVGVYKRTIAKSGLLTIMRLFFRFLILVFCVQRVAVSATAHTGPERMEKEVLLQNWVRVLAQEKVRNIALFDKSMHDDFADQENSAGYGFLGAGRQLIKSVNKSEKAIVVVIPSYDNCEYYKQNLDSVFAQNYHNFRVIYVDDASPDQTGPLVKQYIKEKGQEDRGQIYPECKTTRSSCQHL